MFMNLKVQESKMLILSSMIYWVKKILNKMHASYFYRHRQAYYKLILKFTGKGTFPRIAEIILLKKNKVGRFTLANIKAYYMAPVIKIVCSVGRDSYLDQWVITENTNSSSNTSIIN